MNEGAMTAYKFLVFTNPKRGREDEYNRWYSTVHVHEILAISGFRQAQRFELQPEVSASDEWRYLVVYDIETDDLTATIGELRRRNTSGEMPVSDAMEPRRTSYMFRALGPLVVPAA
jgi:hypothetical protein